MRISCTIRNLSHGYGGSQLFSGLQALAENGSVHLITGSNGSGKSTLLKLLSSAVEPESGSVVYAVGDDVLEADKLREQIAFVAPYQEFPEEFSLMELIEFQNVLGKGAGRNQGPSSIAAFTSVADFFGLDLHSAKPLRDYSTGMRQKAKFVLAFGSGRPIWLLDEPGSNLDASSNNLLQQMLLENCREKLIILASNDPAEISIGRGLIHLGVS